MVQINLVQILYLSSSDNMLWHIIVIITRDISNELFKGGADRVIPVLDSASYL